MIIPLSDALAWLVDFAVTFVIFADYDGFLRRLSYNKNIGYPLYLLFVLATTMAVGLWTASLTVKFRDLRLVVQYGLRIFMFVTPVAYTAANLEAAMPEGWAWILKMNPLYWVTEGFRWALLDSPNGPDWFMIYPIALVLVLLISGAYVFRKKQNAILLIYFNNLF
jgi:lipopolysaccharide transport system permease protein